MLRSLFFVLLIAFSTASCMTYEEVDFQGVRSFNVKEMNTDNIVLDIDAKIDNPNTYNIKITKTDLDLYLDGKYIGKAKLKNKVKIIKKSNQVYGLTVEAKLENVLGLTSLLGGSPRVRAKGYIKAKAFGIGKKVDIDVTETVRM